MYKRIFLILLLLLLWNTILSASELEGWKLSIIYTNDIHGGIDVTQATFMNPEYPPILGGGASATTYINKVREMRKEDDGSVLLLDAGDFFQGTPLGTNTAGSAIIEWMNRTKYDAMALGNHDFDKGSESLQDVLKASKFPILGANLIDAKTDKIVDWVKPYVIIEQNGLKIAIIGLITLDTATMSFQDNIAGLKFKPVIPITKYYVEEVKEQNVDLIILLTHIGLPFNAETTYRDRYIDEKYVYEGNVDALELIDNVPEIDLMICGHTHKGYRQPWEDPVSHTIMVETYGRGSSIGHIDLIIDPETKSIMGYTLPGEDGGLITLFEDEWWPDKEISPWLIEETEKAEEGLDDVIGETKVFITRGGEGETLMGNLVMDAFREAMNADFAFTNLGSIRDEIDIGIITARDVFSVQPFGNMLALITFDGETLKQLVEDRISGGHHGLYVSGGKIVWNKTRPDGDKITYFEIAGKPWDPKKTYTAVTTDFIAQGMLGGYEVISNIPEDQIYYSNLTDMEAVLMYIKNHTPVEPKLDGRWIRNDEAEKSPEMERALKLITP